MSITTNGRNSFLVRESERVLVVGAGISGMVLSTATAHRNRWASWISVNKLRAQVWEES